MPGQRSPEAAERRKAGQLAVYLTPERRAKLGRLARAREVSLAALVSWLVDQLEEPSADTTAPAVSSRGSRGGR